MAQILIIPHEIVYFSEKRKTEQDPSPEDKNK